LTSVDNFEMLYRWDFNSAFGKTANFYNIPINLDITIFSLWDNWVLYSVKSASLFFSFKITSTEVSSNYYAF
jgi:hypothetical protein